MPQRNQPQLPESHLFQFSVVLRGKTHNPSILNPDFLAIRGIVPQDWGWKVSGSPITTPPFARVSYDVGVTITADPNKLQVIDVTTSDPTQSKATLIAVQYLRTLPHVRYLAVGINFQSAVEVENPDDYLKQRFIRSGPWDVPQHPLDAAGLRLVYALPEGRIILSLDSGEVYDEKDDKKGRPVVFVNANFHRECQDYPSDQQMLAYLDHAADDWSTYQSLLNNAVAFKS